MREFVDTCCRYKTTAGNEAPAQQWFRGELEAAGFETYTWTADAAQLATHPSFPADPSAIDVDERPSVGGVLEFGDPNAGPTLVLNGHMDVVPTGSGWDGDPFTPRWHRGDDGEHLTARGAVDMKSGLAACVFAAKMLEGEPDLGLNGRVVVESVAGEEEGGIGATASVLENPYPFSRDAVIVAEPTALHPVTAVEGSLMVRIRFEGRSAHAATRWRGTSVLPALEAVRAELEAFERERAASVHHPLYTSFPVPWPICIGRVEAGRWASSVADSAVAEVRVGVAPGETVAAVEAALRDRLSSLPATLEAGISGPRIERFSVQFEPAETPVDAGIVKELQAAMGRWDSTRRPRSRGGRPTVPTAVTTWLRVFRRYFSGQDVSSRPIFQKKRCSGRRSARRRRSWRRPQRGTFPRSDRPTRPPIRPVTRGSRLRRRRRFSRGRRSRGMRLVEGLGRQWRGV